MTHEEKQERAEMWENFLWSCDLGTVVCAADQRVWQKRSKEAWTTPGSISDYSAGSIVWPVDVLMGGLS